MRLHCREQTRIDFKTVARAQLTMPWPNLARTRKAPQEAAAEVSADALNGSHAGCSLQSSEGIEAGATGTTVDRVSRHKEGREAAERSVIECVRVLRQELTAGGEVQVEA